MGLFISLFCSRSVCSWNGCTVWNWSFPTKKHHSLTRFRLFSSHFMELINTAKLQRQHMVATKSMTRSSDRNDVITNVPAIISTSASPTDLVPLNPLANLIAPLATKRHGRILQKSSGGEQLSLEIDAIKSPLPTPYSHARSDDLAYCMKCGGLTTVDKCILTKKRYFSLDKERNERTMNFLQCFSTMNRGDTPNIGSDNLLSNSRKQCSFDGGTSEKSFGRLSNCNNPNSNSNSNSNSKAKPSSDCGAGGGGGITHTSSSNSNQMVKNGTSSSLKKGHTHRECTTSSSNRSFKDKSNSQNSLREARTTTSRKNSVFYFGSMDRDASSMKSKRVSQQYSRKASTRGPINLHEEQDSETREILLGGSTSHSKFDKFPHEIKIPEPVEAVR